MLKSTPSTEPIERFVTAEAGADRSESALDTYATAKTGGDAEDIEMMTKQMDEGNKKRVEKFQLSIVKAEGRFEEMPQGSGAGAGTSPAPPSAKQPQPPSEMPKASHTEAEELEVRVEPSPLDAHADPAAAAEVLANMEPAAAAKELSRMHSSAAGGALAKMKKEKAEAALKEMDPIAKAAAESAMKVRRALAGITDRSHPAYEKYRSWKHFWQPVCLVFRHP